MNHEMKVIQLRRLRDEIRAEREVRAMVAGAASDAALMVLAEGWMQRLANAQRDIRSGFHLNAMIHEQARFARDRSARYAARRSRTDKDRNLEVLYRTTAEIAHELTHLLQQGPTPAPPEAKALETIAKSIKKILESAGQDTATMQNFGLGSEEATITTSVRQLERGGGMPGPTSALPVIDMFTLILAYFALIKAWRKR